ncbi:MAG: flagellar export protein FliJ, partial [Alkalispirochaeta sp.]
MRRFRFRLQSILDLRVHEEEQRRLELGAITSRYNTVAEAIAARREERRQMLSSRPAAVEGTDIHWRSAVEYYALRLKNEADRLEEQLLVLEQERRVATDRYREARQKAEVLRKLREKRERAYIEEFRRAEQKILDEVAQSIHTRG